MEENNVKSDKERIRNDIKKYELSKQTMKFPLKLMTVVLLISGLSITFMKWLEEIIYNLQNYYPTLLSLLFIVSIFFLNFVYRKSVYDRKIKRARRVLIEKEQDELSEKKDSEFIKKLVQINIKYIDEYYNQTKQQANKSFNLSVAVLAMSFLLIIIGVAMIYNEAIAPGYVIATSGLLSEIISVVFFYLFNKTSLKMGEYHKKLMISQNITFAIKVADEMETEAKVKAKMKIIEELTKDVNKQINL